MTISRDTETSSDPVGTTYAVVLVPLDGSEDAQRAIAAGWMLGRSFGAALHVVTAGVGRAERSRYQGYLDRLDPGPGPKGPGTSTTTRTSPAASWPPHATSPPACCAWRRTGGPGWRR